MSVLPPVYAIQMQFVWIHLAHLNVIVQKVFMEMEKDQTDAHVSFFIIINYY